MCSTKSEKFPQRWKTGLAAFTDFFSEMSLKFWHLLTWNCNKQRSHLACVFLSCSRVPIWLVIHLEHCLWTMLQVCWGCVQIWEHAANLPVSTYMQGCCWCCLHVIMEIDLVLDFFPPSELMMYVFSPSELVCAALQQRLTTICCSFFFFFPCISFCCSHAIGPPVYILTTANITCFLSYYIAVTTWTPWDAGLTSWKPIATTAVYSTCIRWQRKMDSSSTNLVFMITSPSVMGQVRNGSEQYLECQPHIVCISILVKPWQNSNFLFRSSSLSWIFVLFLYTFINTCVCLCVCACLHMECQPGVHIFILKVDFAL